MSDVLLEHVSRAFGRVGDRVLGLDDFSLRIDAATIQVWLGQSGSGKSTAARCIAGLISDYGGRITLDGRDIGTLAAYLRSRELGVYYVSQSAVLFPHLKVRGNVLFGTELAGVPIGEMESRIREAFEMTFPALIAEAGEEAREAFLNKGVHQLSGGERQRVGLMKAMVRRPHLLILDEPLSNVDAPQRADVRRGILRWQRRHRATTIWITHDQHEAVAVATTIAVIDRGHVLQVGPAAELAASPSHRQVASLVCAGLGSPMSFVQAQVTSNGNGALELVCGTRRLMDAGQHMMDGPWPESFSDTQVVAGLRADQLRLVDGHISESGLEAEVVELEPTAHGAAAICETAAGIVVVHLAEACAVHVGQRVVLAVTHVPPLFRSSTGEALSLKAAADHAASGLGSNRRGTATRNPRDA